MGKKNRCPHLCHPCQSGAMPPLGSSPWLWNIREGSFEALVASPGPGSRRSRPGLETATKQTVILPPLSSLLQHRRQQHCCQHSGRTLHTTLQNSTLARSNISCTFLYLYCGKDFTKHAFNPIDFFGSFDQMYSNSTLILCNAWYWYIIMQIVLLIWYFSNSVDKK